MSHVTQLSESQYITNAINMDFDVIMLMQSHSGQSPTSRLLKYVLSESEMIAIAINMDSNVIVNFQSCLVQSRTSRLDNYAKNYGHGIPL